LRSRAKLCRAHGAGGLLELCKTESTAKSGCAAALGGSLTVVRGSSKLTVSIGRWICGDGRVRPESVETRSARGLHRARKGGGKPPHSKMICARIGFLDSIGRCQPPRETPCASEMTIKIHGDDRCRNALFSRMCGAVIRNTDFANA
jgi:hypothetical protein